MENAYAVEALNSLYEKTVDPLIDKLTSIDFANSYFSNQNIPEYQKFSALRRNIIADENAIFNLSGEYSTGKKPAMGIGLKEILIAIGVLAAAGGGYAIAKKYDIGMDDISATIVYLEAKTVGASSIGVFDSPTHTLAPTPVPTVVVANASVEEEYQFSPDIKIIGSPEYKQKVQKALDEIKRVDIDEYNEVKPARILMEMWEKCSTRLHVPT